MPNDIDVRAAREALKTTIDTITGLSAHSRFPGIVNPPAAVVYRRETRYDPTFDVGADISLGVRLYMSISNPTGAQDNLDAYLAPTGARSLKAAIEGNPTLSGTVDWLKVSTAEAEGVVEFNGVNYISADLIVEVG